MGFARCASSSIHRAASRAGATRVGSGRATSAPLGSKTGDCPGARARARRIGRRSRSRPADRGRAAPAAHGGRGRPGGPGLSWPGGGPCTGPRAGGCAGPGEGAFVSPEAASREPNARAQLAIARSAPRSRAGERAGRAGCHGAEASIPGDLRDRAGTADFHLAARRGRDALPSRVLPGREARLSRISVATSARAARLLEIPRADVTSPRRPLLLGRPRRLRPAFDAALRTADRRQRLDVHRLT